MYVHLLSMACGLVPFYETWKEFEIQEQLSLITLPPFCYLEGELCLCIEKEREKEKSRSPSDLIVTIAIWSSFQVWIGLSLSAF